MSMDKLKPCPFCQSGQTISEGKYMAPKMSGESRLISWRVSHWCQNKAGVVEFRGREEVDAITAWNTRPGVEQAVGDGTK